MRFKLLIVAITPALLCAQEVAPSRLNLNDAIKPYTTIAVVPESNKTRNYWATSIAGLVLTQIGDVLSSRGGYESNTIVGRGQFRTEQAAFIKVGLIGPIITMQVLMHKKTPRADLPMAIMNTALSAYYAGYVIPHNVRVQEAK